MGFKEAINEWELKVVEKVMVVNKCFIGLLKSCCTKVVESLPFVVVIVLVVVLARG